jgi:hypothetical protein
VKKGLVSLGFDSPQHHAKYMENLDLDTYFASQNRNEIILTELADSSVRNG